MKENAIKQDFLQRQWRLKFEQLSFFLLEITNFALIILYLGFDKYDDIENLQWHILATGIIIHFFHFLD
jgi:hypothetical protein